MTMNEVEYEGVEPRMVVEEDVRKVIDLTTMEMNANLTMTVASMLVTFCLVMMISMIGGSPQGGWTYGLALGTGIVSFVMQTLVFVLLLIRRCKVKYIEHELYHTLCLFQNIFFGDIKRTFH